MGWVKDRQNTQKPKTEKKKEESRTHHPKQNSSNVLSVSLLDQVYRLMVIRKGVFLCFLSVGARCFFFLLLDGLGDHFGFLFGTKMWLKQYVFVCVFA